MVKQLETTAHLRFKLRDDVTKEISTPEGVWLRGKPPTQGARTPWGQKKTNAERAADKRLQIGWWRGSAMAALRGTELVHGSHKHTHKRPAALPVKEELGLLQHYSSLRNYSITASPLQIKRGQNADEEAAVRFRIASRNGPRRSSPTRERGERYRFPRVGTTDPASRPHTSSGTRNREGVSGSHAVSSRRLSAQDFQLMQAMELPSWKQKIMMEMSGLDETAVLTPSQNHAIQIHRYRTPSPAMSPDEVLNNMTVQLSEANTQKNDMSPDQSKIRGKILKFDTSKR